MFTISTKISFKSLKTALPDIFIWVAIILWCILIFSFSAENSDLSSGTSGRVCKTLAQTFIADFSDFSAQKQQQIVENMQFYVRKAAHFSIYAVLGFLLALAFRRLKSARCFLLSLALTAAYAISDEIHQLFVGGRSGRALDVLIDSAGGSLGAAVALILILLLKSLKKKFRAGRSPRHP